jgi:hypothetical protein
MWRDMRACVLESRPRPDPHVVSSLSVPRNIPSHVKSWSCLQFYVMGGLSWHNQTYGTGIDSPSDGSARATKQETIGLQ